MAVLEESLVVEGVDGELVEPAVVSTPYGGRVHVVRAPGGRVRVSYFGEVRPSGEVQGPGAPDVLDRASHQFLRQSRYCPSDELQGFARREVGHLRPGWAQAEGVADWVYERIGYETGSSGPLDGAVDTLLAGHGVCRDFAHLAVTLCRAVEIPARLVAVYAPGLSPMDFHAVVEVRVDGVWWVLDPTRLAPRSSLVRIATGRDAADTSFLTTLHGEAELLESSVTAVVDGDLDLDDHRSRMALI
jgi:transglutaminase-like putative cysteine protease